uniref:Uncharacterized protein n=1 Tax=Oryza punctata TaxID=4537 RepID=A0A0E0L3E5_ORYPU
MVVPAATLQQQAQRGEEVRRWWWWWWGSSLQSTDFSLGRRTAQLNSVVSLHHQQQQKAGSHGRGEEEEGEGEGEEEEAQGEGEGGHRGGALQAERGGEGGAVRRAVHREVVHGAAGVAAGAAAAAGHPAGVPERVPEPAVPVDHGVHAHQLHHPGAPGVAHAHAGAGHQEVQGGALRVRVRGHEGRRRPALAGHDPARGRQQEAHPGTHRQRDGAVQVQEGLPHHLRLRRPPPRRRRLHVRRRPQEDTRVGGGAQGFLGSHRHARHAQPEEHHLAVPGRSGSLIQLYRCRYSSWLAICRGV